MNAPVRIDNDHLYTASIAVEQSFIGACLNSPEALAIASAMVEDEQFSEAAHVTIWKAMTALAGEGRPVSVVTLVGRLGNPVIADGCNLSLYLARCMSETTCPSAHIVEYAKLVREYWACRELTAVTDEVRAACAVPGANPHDLLSEVMQRADEARARLDPRRTGFRTLGQINVHVLDRMTSRMQGDVTEACITTGLRDLDKMLGGGFRRGELVILAGRPGMGKTSAAVSIARQAAKAGHSVGFFSLEMVREQIAARMLADEVYNGPHSPSAGAILHAADLSDRDAQKIIDASRDIESLPLHIDDSSSLSVGEISARSRSLAAKFEREHRQLELIVIDYLKFVKASERYRGQRHYEVGEISAGLKTLAKDLNCAVVLLAQINRQVESREDKRPTLADLRESGDLEADADVVIFLYREIYYLQQREPQAGTCEHGEWELALEQAHNKLEIIIAKQRIGMVGRSDVFCDVASSTLRDLDGGRP